MCAVPSDTVGWLTAQLDPRGDAVTVATAIADPFLFALPVAYGADHAEQVLLTVGEYGYGPDATIGDIARATPIVQPVQSLFSLTG